MIRRPTVKRLFGLILFCAILACALCGVTAVAAAEVRDAEFEFNVTREGDEVVAVVTLTKNDGIMDLYLRVDYDADALELTKRTFGTLKTALSLYDNIGDDEYEGYEAPYRVTGTALENVEETGRLMTLRFKAKKDAKNGEHSLKLVVRQVGHLEGETADDIVYNEKYGAPVNLGDDASIKTGGKTVAEMAVVTSKGVVTDVRAPRLASDKVVMIVLIVGGAAIFVVAGIVAYLFYRKKNVQPDNK